MHDPIKDGIEGAEQLATIHDIMAGFLAEECGFSRVEYDTLMGRIMEWAHANKERAAMNPVSPLIVLEQVRRAFDDTVPFLPFALIVNALQMGPVFMQPGGETQKMWCIALDTFPVVYARAREMLKGKPAGAA